MSVVFRWKHHGFSQRLQVILFLCLVLGSSGVFGQQPEAGGTPTPWSLFVAKQYRESLAGCEKQLAEVSTDTLPRDFFHLLWAAIAIDRAGMKDDPVAQLITGIIQNSPDAMRYFTATQKLLSGNLKAVAEFFEEQSSSVAPGGRQDGDTPLHYQGSDGKSTPPPFEQWERAPATLREHGYEVQSRLFTAVAVLGPMRNPAQRSVCASTRTDA